MSDDESCGAMAPTADLAVRVATVIDGHHDSDTVSVLNDALEAVLPGWLADYGPDLDAVRAQAKAEALREAAESFVEIGQWKRVQQCGDDRAVASYAKDHVMARLADLADQHAPTTRKSAEE